MTDDADLVRIFVYLAASPLFGLTVTLVVYQAATWVYRRAGQTALLHPVLLSVAVIGLLLFLTGVDYRTYFGGAQFIHFLLGPATVALAVPLYREVATIRRAVVPILVAVVLGSAIAIGSAVALAVALGASPQTVASLAPKSATAPVAMSLSEQLGGVPALTAALAVLTGITGAVAGPAVLRLARVRDVAAEGLGLGVASHGIGTARALQTDETAGAFAGVGFALNALATAVLVPLLALVLL